VAKLLDVLEVSCLSDLHGAACRVVHTDTRILQVGHVVRDRWWDPEAILRDVRADWLGRVEWARQNLVPVLVPRMVAGSLEQGGGLYALQPVQGLTADWQVAGGAKVATLGAPGELTAWCQRDPKRSPDRQGVVTARVVRQTVAAAVTDALTLSRFKVGLAVERLDREGHTAAADIMRDTLGALARDVEAARRWPEHNTETAADAAGSTK
jgi:hypothetical protein